MSITAKLRMVARGLEGNNHQGASTIVSDRRDLILTQRIAIESLTNQLTAAKAEIAELTMLLVNAQTVIAKNIIKMDKMIAKHNDS